MIVFFFNSFFPYIQIYKTQKATANIVAVAFVRYCIWY